MNIFLDKCHPRGRETCRNGGTCEVNEEGTVSCHCSANHSGVYCDTGKISTPVKCLSLAFKNIYFVQEDKLRFNCVSFQQISVFREEYQHAKIAETALLQKMAMLHVIVQNTSKELVAKKVTKIDSWRPLNYVIFKDFH